MIGFIHNTHSFKSIYNIKMQRNPYQNDFAASPTSIFLQFLIM